jgi:uncharacterized protein YjdB
MRRYFYRNLKTIVCIISIVIVFGISENLCQAEEIREDYEDEKEAEISSQITDIEILEYDDELYVGAMGDLRVKIVPESADKSNVHYESSNENIVTVNSDGEIKAISKGSATITITADNVIKQVDINVKVKTKAINVLNSYIVLKPGERYRIEASVSPEDAEQLLSYKTMDASVADVDVEGNVIANNSGATTIIVSNGQISNSINVIVNKDTADNYRYGDPVNIGTIDVGEIFDCPDVVYASTVECLDAEFLYNLNKSGKSVKIVGEGYSIIIDGKKIKNFKNILYTNINMVKTDNGLEFEINKGQKLCGEIKLELDDLNGGKLYLFNDEKGKYELLDTDDIACLTITREGKYIITDKRLGAKIVNLKYILIGAAGLSAVALSIYIFSAKRYWFW